MNKSELVEAVASGAGLSKVHAAKAIDALTSSITKAMKKGEKITLVGFGTFAVGRRKARNGRNPKTGATIKIPARKVARFKAGKALSDSIR